MHLPVQSHMYCMMLDYVNRWTARIHPLTNMAFSKSTILHSDKQATGLSGVWHTTRLVRDNIKQ